MPRRPLLPLAAIAAFMLSAAAQAQEAPVSPPASSAAAPAHKSYSPDEMSSFAKATVELQNLGSQDPEQMTKAIQGAGMSVEDYNKMGDAMRGDPKLASSLTPYLDSANTERAARVYAERSRTPSFAGQPRRTTSHHAVAVSHKTSRHSRGATTHKASHTRTTKHTHVTKASHKRTTSAARHATRKTSAHKASSTAHKSRKHKRS